MAQAIPTCPYAVLGVSPAAPWDAVRAAYKERAMECHPDKGGDKEQFQRVAEAFDVLQKRMDNGELLKPRAQCESTGAAPPYEAPGVPGFPGSPWVPGSPSSGSIPHAGSPGTWCTELPRPREVSSASTTASGTTASGSTSSGVGFRAAMDLRRARLPPMPAGQAMAAGAQLAQGRASRPEGLLEFIKSEVQSESGQAAAQADGIDPERHKEFVEAACRRGHGGGRKAELLAAMRKSEQVAAGKFY